MGIENCPANIGNFTYRRNGKVEVTYKIDCLVEGCRLSEARDMQGPVILRFPSAAAPTEEEASQLAKQKGESRRAEHCLFADPVALVAPQAPPNR